MHAARHGDGAGGGPARSSQPNQGLEASKQHTHGGGPVGRWTRLHAGWAEVAGPTWATLSNTMTSRFSARRLRSVGPQTFIVPPYLHKKNGSRARTWCRRECTPWMHACCCRQFQPQVSRTCPHARPLTPSAAARGWRLGEHPKRCGGTQFYCCPLSHTALLQASSGRLPPHQSRTACSWPRS